MSKRSVRGLNNATLQILAERTEIQAAGEEGKQPTFSMLLYAGGPMRPGGWTKPHPIVVDLSGMIVSQGKGKPIPFNRGHEGDGALVGHGTPTIEAGQIKINDGVFSIKNEHSDRIIESSKTGFPWGASMEATVSGHQFIAAGKSVRVNNRTISGPVYVARKSELFAGAFIGSNPADRSTTVSIAAKDNKMPEALKTWLEAKGVEIDGMDEATITAWQADYDVIQAASNEPTETVTEAETTVETTVEADAAGDIRASAVSEATRISKINAMFGDRFDEIKIECIGNAEMTIEGAQMKFDRAELDEEIANRPTGPAIHASGSEELQTADIYAASMFQKMRPETKQTQFIADSFGEKNAELAEKLPKSAGLKYLLHQTIRAAGGNVDVWSISGDDLIKAAFRANARLVAAQDIHAASSFSTFSLSDTLSNLAHKMLLKEYQDWPSLVDDLCDHEEHTDFKEWTKIMTEGDVEAKLLSPTGEITHGTLSDSKYTSKLETYARMLAVTRTDYINDDLSAFSRNGKALGRGQMQNREKLMYRTLLDPANVGTFFRDAAAAVGNGQDERVINRLTAQGAPSGALLQNVEDRFDEMENENGEPIVMSPDFILSNTKQYKAFENLLVKSTVTNHDDNVASPGARTEQRIANEWTGRMALKKSPWLNQRPIMPGSSNTLSFAFGNKMDAAGLEYITLRGAAAPTIQSTDTDFNTLGTQTRSYWDVAFTMRNPRGIIRIEG